MNRKTSDTISILVFLLPAAILFCGILIAPMVMSGYYSLYKWDGLTKPIWNGFKNYKMLFNDPSVRFGKAIVHALILAGLSLAIQLPISLGLALMLGRGIKGERFFLSVNFLPVLISTVVIGMLWKQIYQPEGLLNNLLRAVGYLKGANSKVKGADPNIKWLKDGDKGKLLLSCLIPMLWQYVGYHMLLMYAGVKSVATDLREAAKIDGATPGQVDRYIVIPSMKQVLKVSVIFAVTGSLKAYDLVSILGGDINTSACVPSTVLMEQMFSYYRYGVGSAIAVMLILMCFAFAILINFLFKERD